MTKVAKVIHMYIYMKAREANVELSPKKLTMEASLDNLELIFINSQVPTKVIALSIIIHDFGSIHHPSLS